MITPKIISYIKTEQAKKVPDDAIRTHLLSTGWSDQDISEAMNSLLSAVSGAVPVPVAISAAKQFRRKRMWLIFWTWMGLAVIFTFLSLISSNSYGNFLNAWPGTIILVIFAVPVILAASYIVSLGSEPRDRQWKEILELIVRIIAAGAFILILSFGIFFASCLFIISTGGMGNF